MRFAFYNRVSAEDQQDPEQVARYRAVLESILAKYGDTADATYLEEDGRESPYRRTTKQPSREKSIP